MDERRSVQRGRTFLGGKIIFNAGRSAIDCKVRNLSNDGACLEVESQSGIPVQFQLLVTDDKEPRACTLAWQSEHRLGVSFEQRRSESLDDDDDGDDTGRTEPERTNDLLRGHLLALRASLDQVRFGVVLLDQELRAQFINRAFRKMFRLPDHKADLKPPFVALMYHGRDTRAYDVPAGDLDAYVAERVEHVKIGDPTPRDLRLASGEVLRMQCAILPNGGRMLSYIHVTDIVRHSDELEVLKAALDQVQDGVILLDADLNASFMNQAVRQLWNVSDQMANSNPPYSLLVGDVRRTGVFGVPSDQLEALIASRIAVVRAGDTTPHDIRTSDGRHIRTRCAILPDGGRMLTYCDITDLVRNAEQLERLATIDPLTGICNRRHFVTLAEAEWTRFQRYHRPLSMLMIDTDHFKPINDRFGHSAGDEALSLVARTCREGQRTSDVLGRIGGDEFALLLPETDIAQACIVADRIRSELTSRPFVVDDVPVTLTLSIGVAAATLSMSGAGALMKAADRAMYSAKAQGRNRVMLFEAKAQPQPRLAAE
jgi:diguanylate cyclase (GGDEF)-like protein